MRLIFDIVVGMAGAIHAPMQDESIVDREIKKIEAWLAKTGMAESRLGMLACANQRAVERVRNKTATLETFQALIDYISKNPPKASD